MVLVLGKAQMFHGGDARSLWWFQISKVEVKAATPALHSQGEWSPLDVPHRQSLGINSSEVQPLQFFTELPLEM